MSEIKNIKLNGTKLPLGGSGAGGTLKYKTLHSFESVSGDTFTFPTNLVFEKDVVYVAIVQGFVFNLYTDSDGGSINADGNVNVGGEAYSIHLFHNRDSNTFKLTGKALSDGSDFPYTEHISQFDICQIVGGSGGSGSGTSKVFEDVTELPESPNSNLIYRVKQTPQPVPNDGSTIGTLYFNTEMSPYDLYNKVNSMELQWLDGALFGQPASELYPICMFDGSSMSEFNNDPFVALIIARTKNDHTELGISFQGFTTGYVGVVFVIPNLFWCWSHSQILNTPCLTNFQGIPIGTQNELLSDIVSITDAFNQPTKYINYDGKDEFELNIKKPYTKITYDGESLTTTDNEFLRIRISKPDLVKEVLDNLIKYGCADVLVRLGNRMSLYFVGHQSLLLDSGEDSAASVYVSKNNNTYMLLLAGKLEGFTDNILQIAMDFDTISTDTNSWTIYILYKGMQ